MKVYSTKMVTRTFWRAQYQTVSLTIQPSLTKLR
ncbi:Uncharacterised protein [Vibrio cholerae]|nr:Uncharacterised protein [Vibrio cholerae]